VKVVNLVIAIVEKCLVYGNIAIGTEKCGKGP
jgi:hypothetical protein